MKKTKSEKTKARRKDFVKKKNINANKPGQHKTLAAGDGILPKSKKWKKS